MTWFQNHAVGKGPEEDSPLTILNHSKAKRPENGGGCESHLGDSYTQLFPSEKNKKRKEEREDDGTFSGGTTPGGPLTVPKGPT